MAEQSTLIPDPTIEAIARTLYREGRAYGFAHIDYVRLVNQLLDMSLRNCGDAPSRDMAPGRWTNKLCDRLPAQRDGIGVRAFDAENDRMLLQRWVEEDRGRYFLLSRHTGAIRELTQLIASEQTVLGLITVETGAAIGVLAYLDWDRGQRKAELRKLIGDPRYRGRGYAKRATRLWIEYGLARLGLRKVYLNTLNTDLRNIRLNEELGFQVEGILRNECWVDGRSHDILRMGLVAGIEGHQADSSQAQTGQLAAAGTVDGDHQR